jgi:quinol monooxygenase YgiN
LRASREAAFFAAGIQLKGALMTSTIALVRHQVADFDAWKKVYDGFVPVQTEHGVHAYQVLRSIEKPNEIIVTHTFASRESARNFFAMPELKEAMSQAGVNADSLEISYFDEVESGALVGA